MNAGYDPQRLDALLQLLLDGELSAAETAELNTLLRGSPQARRHYRTTVRLHAALIRNMQGGNVIPLASRKSRKTPWILAAAACVGIACSLLFRPPAATLTGTTAAVWTGVGPGAGLMDAPLELTRGFAEVSYRSGVRVILEGPCLFQVTSPDSMEVAHGRASVKVPHRMQGFHLDTPAGRITDLGTEFGVAVGSGVEGPVVLTEVFDGEIEIPAEIAARKRLHVGDSLAIVRETGGTKLISMLGDYRVSLSDSARQLPSISKSPPETGNLALGKPVTSPAYYDKPHGSVFPPGNLTDGRLNDSGSPGDWSFWLAPNGADGEFTVDLLTKQRIGRIDLQNTRNRTHGDRGMRDFQVLVSGDGAAYRQILAGTLERLAGPTSPGVDFPIQSFSFPAVEARFLKIVGLSHYRHPDRPADHPHRGGGLNEIRIFAP